MSAITEASQEVMERTRGRAHPRCVVCSRANGQGLGTRFCVRDDGSVSAEFDGLRVFEGYPDTLHGGVIASMLDAAMTNCLFAHGIVAVTAELAVRFRHPIETACGAGVCARIVRACPPLYVLEARLTQNGKLKATATGKFMEKPAAQPMA